MNTLLPWHEPAWARLQSARRAGRLPHALLLCGQPGMGKARFAGLLGRSLLCQRPDAGGLACGACPACMLTQAGTHPDLRHCEPVLDPRTEREKESIGVDQVRELSDYMALKSHHGGHKAVIVRPADKLNINAANALLKTLEEPPEGALLILVTAHPARLPATVLSRCQRLEFPAAGEAARGWLRRQLDVADDPDLLLALAGGAPLSALALAGQGRLAGREGLFDEIDALLSGRADPLSLAESWLKFGVKEALYWLYVSLADMARLKATDAPPYLSNPDQRERLRRLASRREADDLHHQLGRLGASLRGAEGQVNAQLLLEDVLISLVPDTEKARTIVG